MEYMFFICVDPEAPETVAEENNAGEWVAELTAMAKFGRIEIRPF
jgi:hypothetical protein